VGFWLLLFRACGADGQDIAWTPAWRGKEDAWRALWPPWPPGQADGRGGLRTIALPRSRAGVGQAARDAAWIMNPGMLADGT
jgi:hypothetical protein